MRPHEWPETAPGAPLALHIGLHCKGGKSLFNGKHTAARIVQTALQLVVPPAAFGCIPGGGFAAQYRFSFENSGTIAFGRFLRPAATARAFPLMPVHLGPHWSSFIGTLTKISMRPEVEMALRRSSQVLVPALCARIEITQAAVSGQRGRRRDAGRNYVFLCFLNGTYKNAALPNAFA